MRMAVVDAGSNTVRLFVADVEHYGLHPVHTAKWRLRLAEQVDRDGTMGRAAMRRLADAVSAACREGRRWGVREPVVFATAVVRDAPNRHRILRTLGARCDVPVLVLPGSQEAELTFLAARRWTGWQAGPLAVLDIGGGSFEVACGDGGTADLAVSLPLGAGRLTREHFAGQDPPSPSRVKEVRRYAREQMAEVSAQVRGIGPRTVVATSRTFDQLSRLCSPGTDEPSGTRRLLHAELRQAIRQLRRLPSADRARLPGISPARSAQCLAGAIVAETALRTMNVDSVLICPWAIREGVLLRAYEDRARSEQTASIAGVSVSTHSA
ncbi:Ppx/GppA phosphatase family protein [Streptomyces sp. t39]|uniref:Ppx/GppA phosphatase family protein n=1 Tax=Streptomyces sp. t39 TaxID=1828156 RepID=UPI0011CE2932|nr:Ppx/GppA family phosphatase [Streptomyces sp. t39]TXS54188.1 Ppx/GppA family phosphatase [Streptomyces sp. t39]